MILQTLHHIRNGYAAQIKDNSKNKSLIFFITHNHVIIFEESIQHYVKPIISGLVEEQERLTEYYSNILQQVPDYIPEKFHLGKFLILIYRFQFCYPHNWLFQNNF